MNSNYEQKDFAARYQLIFEHLPLGILHYDKHGQITSCNQALVKIVGSTQAAILKLNILMLPDKALKMAVKRTFNGEIGIYEGDYHSITADKKMPVHITFLPILTEDRSFDGGVGMVEDVTQRRQTEDALMQSNENWQAIIAASPDGIGLISLDGRLQFASEKLAAMYGYDSQESMQFIGHWIIDFVDPEDHAKLTENICKLLLGKAREQFSQYRAIRKDGSRFDVEVTSSVLRDAKGKATNILIVERDITDRKAAETALRISEEKYSAIFDESPIAIEIYDKEGTISHINNAGIELFGIKSMAEISGVKLFEDPNIDEQAKAQLREKKQVRFETAFDFGRVSYSTTCSGIKYLDISVKSMLHDAKIDGYIVQIQDITQQKKAQMEIEYLSFHDKLTGLSNRRFFEEEISRLNCDRNLPISLIMADVNGLKLMNDSFGHDMGDELLVRTARTLRKGCRSDEIIARLGGDEFVILLPKTDMEQAEEIVQRIKGYAATERIGAVELSMSFGCATKRYKDEDFQEIFKLAEDRMYRNKLYESASLKSKTINLIMNALYEKSSRETNHSKRVSALCEKIALRMGLNQEDVNQIKVAGLMHDIGKMGIDDQVLNKKDKLTKEELDEIRRHPEIGYRILSSTNEFSEMAVYVLEHQERWDGTGYPKGLKGEAISIQARIIAIADAYGAMTGDRAYRDKMSKEQALTEIRRCSGKQFDPNIADVFLEMAEEDAII